MNINFNPDPGIPEKKAFKQLHYLKSMYTFFIPDPGFPDYSRLGNRHFSVLFTEFKVVRSDIIFQLLYSKLNVVKGTEKCRFPCLSG